MFHINTTVANVPYTKFLGLVTDDAVTCVNHTDQLISGLNCVLCDRCCNGNVVQESFKNVIFSFLHSVISYSIIFGGSTLHNIKLFRIREKKVKSFMTNS
jgi:hypothetical protein